MNKFSATSYGHLLQTGIREEKTWQTLALLMDKASFNQHPSCKSTLVFG
jgi:hypothetical protein